MAEQKFSESSKKLLHDITVLGNETTSDQIHSTFTHILETVVQSACRQLRPLEIIKFSQHLKFIHEDLLKRMEIFHTDADKDRFKF